MIRRTLEQIQTMLGGTISSSHASSSAVKNVTIAGVSTDTRTIQPGALFIPLIGENFDGHAYAAEAYVRGASAALWQSNSPNPPEGMPLIYVEDTLAALQQLAKAYRQQLAVRLVGITGSNGKTTTKDMVASILATSFRTHKTKGNYNNHIGLPLTLLQLEEDTEIAVVEMGMSARGEIEFLSELAEPEAVIITVIGDSHLLQLGSREEIARAKTEILSGLKPNGLFVYSGDEPLIERVLPEMKAPSVMKQLRFGSEASNDLYPVSMELDREGTHFMINRPGYPELYIPLLGKHNVINALAAIGVAEYFGVAPERVAEGLKSLQMTSMRIEKVTAGSGLTVLNDAYNASPTSMKAALQLTEQLTDYSRRIVVLGDMLELGPQEIEFHREIGRSLDPARIEYVFTFGQLAAAIAEEASQKYPAGHVKAYEDKEQLAADLVALASPSDVVLVKGSRGVRLEQVVNVLLAYSRTELSGPENSQED